MSISRHQVRLVFDVFVLFFFIVQVIFFLKAYPSYLKQSASQAALEPGHEFSDFKGALSHVSAAGFLTNKDMSSERNDGQFLAAQYALAPVVLDLNNSRHRFLIFDYTSPLIASGVAQQLPATILLTNEYSKILAEKKP